MGCTWEVTNFEFLCINKAAEGPTNVGFFVENLHTHSTDLKKVINVSVNVQLVACCTPGSKSNFVGNTTMLFPLLRRAHAVVENSFHSGVKKVVPAKQGSSSGTSSVVHLSQCMFLKTVEKLYKT